VLRFGELPTCKPLRTWLAALDQAAQLVVDPLGGWNEPTRKAGAIVRADPALLAAALAAREPPDRDPRWSRAWLSAAMAAEAAIAAELEGIAELSEPGFWRALGSSLADGELVYTASSMPIRDQEAFLPTGDADVLFLANRGANGIDGLVSSGIGAAHASGRPTTIVSGDLGLLHDLGGLASLRAVETPVRIFVLDNGGGGIFEFLPQAEQLDRDEFEALLGTPRPLEVARIAALFDLPYARIERVDQLAGAPRAGLVHVPVERHQNVVLHRRLSEATAAAVREATG
jgi:2-succinyl-5-enolpyruvyl-6-hydroxy-3-cyclohexene-1-carboxylate synthase